VKLPTSTVCINGTDCSSTPGGWTELGSLDRETQALVTLELAGLKSSPVASPWAPLVWYGASAVPYAAAVGWPVAMAAVGGYAGMYVCAANAAVGAAAAVAGRGIPAGSGPCGWAGWGLAWLLGD
jgi:hypothetical protein